ncbi:hypothetical protein [Paramuribaculum intestinale]
MRKDYRLERRKYVVGGFILLIVAIYIVAYSIFRWSTTANKDYADPTHS